MKKSLLFLAAGAILFSSVMSSCQSFPPYEGYTLTETGLNYRFYNENKEGELPQMGDILEVMIGCTVNDTGVVVPVVPNMFQMIEPLFPGDIFEGLGMMHKGDSASFIVNIDSTFRKFFGEPSLPLQYTSKDVMRFEVKMNDFYSESEYVNRIVEGTKANAMMRAENLKSSYPEETAAAAQKLQAYMTANGIVAEPTESGLFYVVTTEGNGEKPSAGKRVNVHYTGKLLDGTVFDSSVERGEPISFPLGVGQVIPGWDEGIQMMSKGEKGVLYIPYFLAYGERDMGAIPPFSNLVFEVELVDFE